MLFRSDRLVARLVELVRLAAEPEADHLARRAQPLGDGAGLAWVEMARGVLVYRVALSDDRQQLRDARVLAPTEWNTHPQGALASALARLDPRDADAATRLAMAFDPCVPFQVECAVAAHNSPMPSQEVPRCTN